jgi:drug/metabolite transporter (DMT)-like permease
MADRPQTAHERNAEGLLVLVMLIWAANYPVTKYGLMRLDAFTYNALRFIVGFLLLFALLASRRAWFRIHPGDRGSIGRLAFVHTIVYQITFILGLNLTSAGNAAVLLSTSPLWTALLQPFIAKDRIRRTTMLGLAVSLVGVILIIAGSGQRFEYRSTAVLGDVLILVSAMLWALATTMQKPLLSRYSTVQLSTTTLGIGAFGLSVIALPSAFTLPWGEIPFSYFLAAIASGALAIGTANVLWTHGVQWLGPSRTANFNNLVPVFAFIISYLTIGEAISWFQIVGTAVTIAGVTIART